MSLKNEFSIFADIMSVIKGSIVSPSLSDKIIFSIYKNIYWQPKYKKQSPGDSGIPVPCYLFNDSCKSETVLLSAFVSTIIFTAQNPTEKEHKDFYDDIIEKAYLLATYKRGNTLLLHPDILNSHIKFYSNHAFDENENFSLENLSENIVPVMLNNVHTDKMDLIDGSVFVHGFTESALAYKELTEFLYWIAEDIIEILEHPTEENTTSNSSSITKQPEEEPLKMSDEDYNELLKLYNGKYLFEATNPKGGFVYIRSLSTNSTRRIFVKKREIIELTPNDRFQLFDCDFMGEYHKPLSNVSKSRPKIDMPIIFFIVSVVVVVVLMAFAFGIFNVDKDYSAPKTTAPLTTHATTKRAPIQYQLPESGYFLEGHEYEGSSSITIHSSSNESYVVKLKTPSGVTRLSFFVRAGDTVTVGVPCETLCVYFASGSTWYGRYNLFGEDTSYSKDNKPCNFEEYTLEYTLYPVTSGNFSETPISADEF